MAASGNRPRMTRTKACDYPNKLREESPLWEASTILEYPASNEGVLLPKAARTRGLKRDTSEAEWDVTFSECSLRPPQVPSLKVLARPGAILAGRIVRIEHHLDRWAIIVPGPNGVQTGDIGIEIDRIHG
jgi:hypothetical protein